MKNMLLFVFLLGTLSFSGYASELPLPQMDEAGRIELGSKSISFIKGYMHYQMVLADKLRVQGNSIFNLGKQDEGVVFFADKTPIRTGNSIVYTARITAGRGETETHGDFRAELTLQEDGMVKISNSYKMDEGKPLPKHCYFYMRVQDKLVGNYQLGSRKFDITDTDIRFSKRPKLSITFYPEDPSRQLGLIPIKYDTIIIQPERGMFRLDYDKDGYVEFLLDLRGEKDIAKSEEYYAGIDFLKVDNLRLPQYRNCRNLIQNPSFESDFRYYALKSYGGYAPFKDYETYSIDDTTAYRGKKSLKITGDQRPIHQVLPMGTFTIPTEPGKKYMLSFYAKTDTPDESYLYVDGRGFRYHLFEDKKGRVINPTGEWQRYHLEFTAPDECTSLYFSAGVKAGAKSPRTNVWLDALQLESEQLTNYTEVPVQSMLVSKFRGNCFDLSDDPEFKLRVLAPSVACKVKLMVKDFNRNAIFSQSYDINGETEIAVPELAKAISTGIFTAGTTVTLNGKKYCEYSRFTVINRLNGKHKNRKIFNVSTLYANTLSPENIDLRLQRLRDIGFGSTVYTACGDVILEKALYDKLASFGFENLSYQALDKLRENGVFEEGDRKIANIRNMTDPTSEQIREIEEICYLKAKNRSWVKFWGLAYEIEAYKPFIDSPQAVAKVTSAMYKGIKRANPQAFVHPGGTPWNISVNGQGWMKGFLQVLKDHGEVKFDGTAIHTYQQGPEIPDLDQEIADYIAMLKPFGYGDKPIIFDEGMNYFEYQLSARGMTPFFGNSGDSWYTGMLSYDMGFAERMAAAFTARHYLAVLKYANQVLCQTDWGHRRNFFDADCTIGAKLVGINTLSTMLGNADYRKTVNFYPQVRSYLFEREDKTPVAAIWGFDPAVDRGEKTPPNFEFDLGGKSYQFTDFMGKPMECQALNGRVSLPVGSFPFFIVGEAGNAVDLERLLSGAKNLSNKTLPAVMSVIPDGTVTRVQVENSSMVELKVTFAGKLNAANIEEGLDIGPQSSANLPLPFKPQTGKLNPFNLELTAAAANFEEKKFSVAGNVLPLPQIIPDQEPNWENIPAISLGREAMLKTAAGNGTLVLMLNMPGSLGKSPLSVIINPAATPENWFLPLQKFQDLFIFELREQDVYVHEVPAVQAASGPETPKKNRIDERIKLTRMVDGERLIVKVTIPQVSVMPLSLAAKCRFGLNVVIGAPPSLLSLAPVKDYRGAAEPGKVNFVLSTIE